MALKKCAKKGDLRQQMWWNTLLTLQKSFENTNSHAKEKYAELLSLCIFHFQAKSFFLIAKMHISINVCQTHTNLWDYTAVINEEFWHLNNGYCRLPDNVELFFQLMGLY